MEEYNKGILDPNVIYDEELSEISLRPKKLSEYIGQNKVKEKTNPNIEEATTALEVLGYTQKQIKEVIEKIDIQDDSVEDIIRKVLKQMQKM